MAGERDLARLLAGMSPVPDPTVYVFATREDGAVPPGVTPLMTLSEAEGLTLILAEDEAAAAGIAAEFRCRRIVLGVHSALDATGFMAAISARLAGLGIPCNPVAGYHHDHLFVPVDREPDAMSALRALQSEAAS